MNRPPSVISGLLKVKSSAEHFLVKFYSRGLEDLYQIWAVVAEGHLFHLGVVVGGQLSNFGHSGWRTFGGYGW